METVLDALVAIVFYVPIGLLVLLEVASFRWGRYGARPDRGAFDAVA